jgi:NADP-dependent 3-hydroxy acid dehydrogenase YdfG
VTGFRAVAITGASRGLGAALARRFAAPGVRLLLIARTGAALREVAAECEALGARAEVAALDVRDAAAMAAALAAFEAAGPVDLAIANAGISAGTGLDGAPEGVAEAAMQVGVNLLGAMHLVGPLLPGMRARGRGAIGLVASVAAFRGLPDCAGYCASKAGLLAWGEALRARTGRGDPRDGGLPRLLRQRDGCAFLGPRPLRLTLDAAAARTHRALMRGAGGRSSPRRSAGCCGCWRCCHRRSATGRCG